MYGESNIGKRGKKKVSVFLLYRGLSPWHGCESIRRELGRSDRDPQVEREVVAQVKQTRPQNNGQKSEQFIVEE